MKKYENIPRYYNEDGTRVGVLVSPGWGAGWSTWNVEEIAFDGRIIEKWVNEKPEEDEMKKFLEELGYDNVYMGGYEDLELEWVDKGEPFYVQEYDGSESLITCIYFIKA